MAEEWGACSRSCGKLGVQVRVVQCLQRLQDGTNRTLHTKYCPGQRPETRRPCGRLPCPAQWRTGAWSEVSKRPQRGVAVKVRCLQGTRSRMLEWFG